LKNISRLKEESSKENCNKKGNPKKNKKKGKKKFKECDLTPVDYNSDDEKKEKSEALKLLQSIFSFTNDEMNELINFFYNDEDLKYIDILVSKLLVKFYGQEFKNEESSDSKTDKKNNDNEEKCGIDIDRKSGIRDVLNSLKYEKKNYKEEEESEGEDEEDKISYRITKFDLKIVESKINEFCRIIDSEGYIMYKIDLHRLRRYQSMYLIIKKLDEIKKIKNDESLNKVKLEIITGKGNHSKNKKAVLFPILSNWLKSMSKKKKFHIDALKDAGKIIVSI